MRDFWLKIKESTIAVLPIAVIVFFIGTFAAGINFPTMLNFFVCCILLIFGISLFSVGVDKSMMKIGSYIGSATSKTKNLFYMTLIAAVMGFVITLAEPDLSVLAGQVPGMSSKWVVILTVSVGTGIFLALALIRIMFKINIKVLMGICYLVILVLCFFVPKQFLPLSFDASGVTTGPISVPFIMAFGLGVSAIRSGKDSQNDSLGLLGIVSIGPIIAIMIMGLFVKPSGVVVTEAFGVLTNYSQIPLGILSSLAKQLLDVLIIIAPIAVIFLFVNFVALHLPKNELLKILIGLMYTYFGIVIFFASVNVGFMPIGYLMGKVITGTSYSWLLIPVALAIGASVVFAEPAVYVLTKQVETLTEGIIHRKVMLFTISIGVALAVCLSVVRNFLGINIIWFIVPLVLLNIILMPFCSNIFVAIAFDSGGVASGAMASAFILPFINGICEAFGNNAMMFAFGTIAFIALIPISSIQVLGVIFKMVQNKKATGRAIPIHTRKAKVKVIDFDYGE